ncbi:hypothetical protein BBJ28_00011298 [Nothophytophthora sp. Chile5]|nr:hypothetical protein BBJ28_00011298 [Nothophytophthora sp. Chile5]
MFYIPLAREFCLWLGCVDASRSTAKKVMDAGHSVFIYPGGVPEIFQLDPYSKEVRRPPTVVNTIVLKKRMGFVKLAIRQGAELVPSFVFGEKWLLDRWNPPKRVIDFFQKTLKIPMIVFWGKFLWMPKQPPQGKKFGVVYGKPIATVQNGTPTDAEVHAIHAEFVAEIQRIFAQYKAKFGYDEGETLVIN